LSYIFGDTVERSETTGLITCRSSSAARLVFAISIAFSKAGCEAAKKSDGCRILFIDAPAFSPSPRLGEGTVRGAC
jgi:hypothetical protein